MKVVKTSNRMIKVSVREKVIARENPKGCH